MEGGEEIILKVILMSLVEFQNVFPMIISMFGIDWDMFKPFSRPLGCEDRFFIAILVKILCQNDQI